MPFLLWSDFSGNLQSHFSNLKKNSHLVQLLDQHFEPLTDGFERLTAHLPQLQKRGGMCLKNTRTRLASSCFSQIEYPTSSFLNGAPGSPQNGKGGQHTNDVNFICRTHYHLPITEKNTSLWGKQNLRGRLGQPVHLQPREQTTHHTLRTHLPVTCSLASGPFLL